MLITTLAAAASKCPACGKPDAHSFSLFSLSGSIDLSCTCGSHKFTLQTGDKSLQLEIPCQYCGNDHIFQIKLKDFSSLGVATFTCPATDNEIVFMGKQEKIVKLFPDICIQSEQLGKIVNECGYDEYFLSPDIMLELLNILCDLAENTKIACECGNSEISIEVFEEKVNLTCECCGASEVFQAIRQADIEKLRNTESIEIRKRFFRCMVDFSRERSKN